MNRHDAKAARGFRREGALNFIRIPGVSAFQCLSACLILLTAGCSSPGDPTRKGVDEAGRIAAEQTAPAPLKPYYQRIYMEGESMAVLNRMRLASAAMELGLWLEAERALMEVVRDVEALGPADARSRQALDDFHGEEVKRFKGEPYERAMAFYLRGLLYLRLKDWSNARACFKSVQFHGAPAGSKAGMFWAGARWLEGWCNRQLGETDAAGCCWAETSRFGMPAPGGRDNLLLVALLGWGPVKVPTGEYGEKLEYREGPAGAAQFSWEGGGARKTSAGFDDLTAYANGRGRRHMDDVNAGKAETKGMVQTAGQVLTVGGGAAVLGGAVADDATVAVAGLGAAAAGMAAQGTASAINAKADTRAWDLLPARIGILSVHVPAGQLKGCVRFLDVKGGQVREVKVEREMGTEPEFWLGFCR
ncbi:MAG: hypothetical protein PHV34_20540 [Verrucomicrobiae bacterium]|nr:hypothetical protein [Verrucomicrobiae bacterium]